MVTSHLLLQKQVIVEKVQILWICYNQGLYTFQNKFNTFPKVRNTSSKPLKHPLTSKHQVLVKTGQVLQIDFQNKIHSCVLLATSSNTLHTTYLNYPNHSQVTVTPFTHFTIFKFWVCRLSSTRSFRPFQSKPSIGKDQGNIKQAQKNLRPHWKLLHCHTRAWLKQVNFKLLSLYLGIIRLRFVKQKCSP